MSSKRTKLKPLRFFSAFITLSLVSSLIYLALTFAHGFFGLGFSGDKPYQNFVIGGLDEGNFRTDSLMVCQYDFYRNSLSILQIPRDTWVSDSLDHKINSAYGTQGKAETMLAMVKEVTGLNVDKFIVVGLKGFRQMIDEIGGVEFDVPFRMQYDDPYQNLHIDLYPGLQTLNGKKAEGFVRWRHNNSYSVQYPEGDVGRVNAQSEFIKAIANKMLSFSNIPKAPKLLSIAKSNTALNFTDNELLSLIISGMKTPPDNINILALPGDSDYINGLSFFIHDKEETAEIMNEYFTPLKDKLPGEKEINLQKNKYLSIEIINAGDIPPELIEALADYLKEFRFNVVNVVSEAQWQQEYSELVDHNAKEAGVEVAKIYPVTNITNDGDKSASCDVTLIIGKESIK